MSVYESDLPGVGKKFEIELGDGERLVIITHNTGKREVFIKAHEGADSEKLFELPDRLARKIGSILEGAYFQPVRTDQVETMLAEGTLLEWYSVEETADLVGQTIANARVRERTGVSIVAIERGDDLIPSPEPDTVIEAGDVLVVIGTQECVTRFEPLVASQSGE